MTFLSRLLSSLFLVSATTAALSSPSAQADNMIQITYASANAGVQVSVGQCPCFRWTIQVQGAGGKIDTRDVLISTDALLQMRQTNSSAFEKLGSRLFKVGAIDALIKEGHVGMGFKGVSWGEDPDRGLADILRAGFYALVNIIQKDALRFDIRTGYDFDRMRAMTGQQIERHIVDQSAVMYFNSGSWSGKVSANVGVTTNRNFDARSLRFGSNASVRTRVVAVEAFEFGLAADASVDYDPLRELLGLDAVNATGTILMDVSVVSNTMSNDD